MIFQSETELATILSSIFPDEDKKEAFLNHYANVYYGKNKSFDFWYGTGNNGKTILFKLFKNAFHEETAHLPSSMLISDIIREKAIYGLNAKIFCIAELNTDERINPESLSKLLDEKTSGTAVIIVNSLEHVSNIEGVNIFNFDSKFVTNPSNVNEFLADKSLLEKIENDRYSNDLRKMLKIKYAANE